MEDFYNYTFSKLLDKFLELGLSKLDAKRAYPWIYKKQADSVDCMTDLPLKVRKILNQTFEFRRIKCEKLLTSSDGTQKALLMLQDGNTIENVLIRDKDRITLCVSTQVGCQMKCRFCNTGTQKFVRNLSVSELVGQYMYWDMLLKQQNEAVTNIVVMGMGEPFMNYANLCDWLEIMLDTFNMSRHRITVSTSGITDNILEFGKRFGVELAISLHASNDLIRKSIMPINNKYNISNILETVRHYPAISNTDHVTFEYLMLRDINDFLKNAKELHHLLKNIKCKVNLITYNEWPGNEFKGSDTERVHQFQHYLKSKGIMCTIRKSKGQDILAACGQLKSVNRDIPC